MILPKMMVRGVAFPLPLWGWNLKAWVLRDAGLSLFQQEGWWWERSP